jgi:putative transposase
VIVAFIDEHKDRFGVEPICAVLSEHGALIAPSTYYDARRRPPSKRQLRDAELVKLIQAERATKFGRLLGCPHDVAAAARSGP